jgi:hypothetical protein
VEGTVNGKATLVAADVDTNGIDPSIILNNNILYANATSALMAISEYDTLIGLEVPNDMVVNGIFISQLGHFGRNHYDTGLPNAWEAYITRNSLTLNGTIVSNGRVRTRWTDGTGVYTSGFNINNFSYDRNLIASPPPLVPVTSDVYQFSEWRDGN